MAKVSLYVGGFVAFVLFAGVTGYVLLGGVSARTDTAAQTGKTEQSSDGGPLYEVAALWQSLENEATSTSDVAASSTEGEGEIKEEKVAEAPPPKKSAPPPPKPAPQCPSSPNPVCGTNGMTYKNECLAKTSGATIDHAGACVVPEEAPAPPTSAAASTPTAEEPETPLSGAYPDFIVRSISTFGTLFEGEPLGFSVIIKNQGMERAFERFNVGLYLDIGNNEVFELSFMPQESHALEKGEEVTLLWSKGSWTQSPGVHTLGACADSEKIIQESLEKNNCETLEFMVPGKADNADLVVSAMRFSPTAPAANQSVSFYADTKNTGPREAATPSFGLWVDATRLSNLKSTNLAAGEERAMEWKTIWRATAGNHTYKICADSREEIAEKDEENNCKEGAFTVSG